MRPSLRFLLLAILGWGGVRAASVGALPGAELFRVTPSVAKPPPLIATQFPAIEPLEAAPADMASPIGQVTAYGAPQPSLRSVRGPSSAPPATHYWTPIVPIPSSQPYSVVPALDEWPLSRIASASFPTGRQSIIVAPGESVPAVAPQTDRLDRIQVTAWALLRQQQTGVAGTPSLANGGTLGASQAGSRLTYNFTRQVAATLRTTSEVGRRGGEVAVGVRIQPARAIPLWFTAERRQRLGTGGSGRNAFALFFESGVYQRPVAWNFAMDAYLQGGVVGRDGFVDGGMTLTRPLFKRISAGVGVWGGMQPGVSRLDVGPRVSVKVRNNMKVHLDWRQRIAGNAKPGSGAALTLAGDF